MTFSEAIRVGAEQRPQGFGELFSEQDGVWHSCALAAALETLGIAPTTDYLSNEVIYAAFPTATRKTGCPLPECAAHWFYYRLPMIVTHLNDDHHWTREAIAEWVATIEEGAA